MRKTIVLALLAVAVASVAGRPSASFIAAVEGSGKQSATVDDPGAPVDDQVLQHAYGSRTTPAGGAGSAGSPRSVLHKACPQRLGGSLE
jgi:anti-sigma factor RsiW